MAYGNVWGVNALVPVVGVIGSSTVPTSAQVASWLTEASAIVDRHVATAGYSIPVAKTATLHAELGALANLYAAAMALQARGLDTVQGTEENRSETMLTRFYTQLGAIAKADLGGMGATPATTSTTTRRRLRTSQVRRVDGYSENALGDEWDQ